MKRILGIALALLLAAPAFGQGNFQGLGAPRRDGAGFPNEFYESSTPCSSSMSDGVTANLTTVVLPPGDWDITAKAHFNFTSGTTANTVAASISTTSTTTHDESNLLLNPAPTTFAGTRFGVYRRLVTTAASTTVYLVGSARFTGTLTCGAESKIWARRR